MPWYRIPYFSFRVNIAHNCAISLHFLYPLPLFCLSLSLSISVSLEWNVIWRKQVKQCDKHRWKTNEKSRCHSTTDLIRKLLDSSFQTWLSHFKQKYFPSIYDCLSKIYRPLHTKQFILHRIFSYFKMNFN